MNYWFDLCITCSTPSPIVSHLLPLVILLSFHFGNVVRHHAMLKNSCIAKFIVFLLRKLFWGRDLLQWTSLFVMKGIYIDLLDVGARCLSGGMIRACSKTHSRSESVIFHWLLDFNSLENLSVFWKHWTLSVTKLLRFLGYMAHYFYGTRCIFGSTSCWSLTEIKLPNFRMELMLLRKHNEYRPLRDQAIWRFGLLFSGSNVLCLLFKLSELIGGRTWCLYRRRTTYRPFMFHELVKDRVCLSFNSDAITVSA